MEEVIKKLSDITENTEKAGLVTSQAKKDEEQVPEYGEKTCESCGTKMSGPGIDENTPCATPENH